MPPRNTDPNKPKGRTSAYAFFVKHQREVSKEKGKTSSFSTFARECADAWKEIDEDAKEKFMHLAKDDKARYVKEMEHYVAPADATRSRRRRKKDPNAPKRPLSAFLFFCQDKRPLVKADNPSLTIGDVAKILGKDWKSTKTEDKKPYEAKAEKDRARYEQAKRDYAQPGREEEEDEEEEYED